MLKHVLLFVVALVVTGQKGGKAMPPGSYSGANGGVSGANGGGFGANGNFSQQQTSLEGKGQIPVEGKGQIPVEGKGQIQGEQGHILGITHQPSAAAKDVLLDVNDAVLLLIDHQSGLFQTVKDVPLRELRANVVGLAKMAELAKIPIFTTASEPNGANGPLMDELAEAAPSAHFIARKGEVSAWDNEEFVKAVEGTGKKTLIIAGVWTSVCVAFPALQAKADGFKVYTVMDASGDMSLMSSEVVLARLVHADIITVTTNVLMAEVQRTWNRPDSAQWLALYMELVPHYKALAESFKKAQSPQSPQSGFNDQQNQSKPQTR
jgi:nicotinamidase-related amidase